jgi:hypothetical protein
MPRLALLLCALLLASCLPESKNPLSSPSASRIDRRLEGVYAPRGKDSDDGEEYWHFHYRGVRTASSHDAPRTTPWLEVMSVQSLKDGGLKTQRYEALTTAIGGRDYMSFIEIPTSGAKTKSLPYKFARYEVNWRGDVRIWIAGDKAFAAAIKAGKLRGTVTHGKIVDAVEITDTTERLAAFIAASDPKVLFGGDSMVLRRTAP